MATWKVEKRTLDYQQEQQKELNAIQQQYAQQNSAEAYRRMVEFESLKPSIQKNALKSAGISTASFQQPYASTSVSPASASSGGTAPNAAALLSSRRQSILQGIGTVGNIAQDIANAVQSTRLNRANISNINADTERIRIDNVYRAVDKIAEINKKLADKDLTEVEAKRAKEALYVDQHTREERIRAEVLENMKTENDISLSKIEQNLKSEEIEKVKSEIVINKDNHELLVKQINTFDENFKRNQRLLESAITKNYKESFNIQVDTWYKSSLKQAQDIENFFLKIKVPYAKEFSELVGQQLTTALEESKTEIQNIKNRAAQLDFETEHQRAKFIAEQVNSYLSSVSTAFGAFFGAFLGSKSSKGKGIPGTKTYDVPNNDIYY